MGLNESGDGRSVASILEKGQGGLQVEPQEGEGPVGWQRMGVP